jgi:molybdopterin/thiamine biosynthesis adenylyltransferase
MDQNDGRTNKMNLHRQLGIIDPELLKKPITIVGAGGIGSITTLLLAKMGFENITVWDDDVIEEHNIPNQMLPLKGEEQSDGNYLGAAKVSALSNLCYDMTGNGIKQREELFDNSRVEGILVLAVDNMKTRKEIFASCKFMTNPELFIDGRMGAENFMVYTIKPSSVDDCSFYEKSLYDDSEAIQEPCTARAIIYNTAFIGSIIASRIKNHLVGKENKREIIGDICSLDLLQR